ncbi:MAG: hypothetical protein QM728_01810 [Gordonia sp. (in: high G+C Gram-positive bacteria)]|uniref:hypothetical protein n=1 Tax=Gordonia sp. (in: high G+C Gram-positive bacteria) TaxID=84139 RepID=UPI0039E319BE
MRSLLAFLTGLIAIAAIVIALPLTWVKERVIEPKGFEATAVRMGESPEVREYMAKTITDEITERTTGAAAVVVRPAADRYTHSEGFTADFVDLAHQQHKWLFNEPPGGTNTSVMQLDLSNMVKRVAGQINPLLANQISGPILVPVSQRDKALEAGRYHETGKQISTWAYLSVALAALGSLLALVFSRRRAGMLAWLGFGAVLSAALSWAAGFFFATRAKDEFVVAEGGVRQVAEVTIDGLVENLHQWALVVGGVGAALMVLGLLGRVIAGR